MKHILASGMLVGSLFLATQSLAQDTIRFAVTDIDGLESLQQEMGPFKDAFETASGLKVEFFPRLRPHRRGRGDGGRSGRLRADRPGRIRGVQRPGSTPAGRDLRPARLLFDRGRPGRQPGAESVRDLKGQKISFGEIGSTSQHLGPVDLLAREGLVYSLDYEPVFLKRNVAVEALIAGEIGGIGLNRTISTASPRSSPTRRSASSSRAASCPTISCWPRPRFPPRSWKSCARPSPKRATSCSRRSPRPKRTPNTSAAPSTPRSPTPDYDPVRKMYENIGITEFTEFVGQ